MTEKQYTEMDKLDREQDTLLALAVYDWHFFNDFRVINLKSDYKVTAKNQDIFHYYFTQRPELIELNEKRYVEHYKTMLNALLY